MSILHSKIIFLSLSLLCLSACQPNTPPSWSGYVEGDYLYLSAPIGGRIDRLAVQAGQQVEANAFLFQLDKEAEEASRDELAARLLVAQAQADNTTKGRRQDELAVTQAQLANAQAQATLAQNDLQRQQQLLTQGFISKAKLDDALTNVKLTQARVKELNAALAVAKLPSRIDERNAAIANTSAAQQALRLANWRSAQKSQNAPVAGQITEVFFRPGEVVAAGQPILSLLAPSNVKLRFFVPESELATIKAGQHVQITCDQCGAPITATITRISSQAEYTPPVIYSNAQRAKLVFMVEAKPDSVSTSLHPGLAIDVKPDYAKSSKVEMEKKS
ncbi:HlyD family secretion protein [Undibacterium flavidum]|uniref:HlyD family efflux transporter periplasmic adaptor subunit n=1 Tax=Undibacterium flavidum TaxID=2762297 RepID=A0ABR6Y656_9BURK|nr:HlyD family secretion protein [Undibacterium flavidum]MBC3872105.1 HlyD family efflux transporter periplasmic adaptor subunit [Undibacterium flavidum]